MNTCSQKKLAQQNPMNPQFGQGDIDSRQYFFTLPNTIDNNLYVYLVQQNTPLFDLQDLGHIELAEHKRMKRNIRRVRKLQRTRWEAEKLVQLKRELRLMHKRSRNEAGVLGIFWWNREYWDEGKGEKRIRVKKEEPSTPKIKVETPPSPLLQYPISWTSTSRFCSIDPNNFTWSPIYRPSPFW